MLGVCSLGLGLASQALLFAVATIWLGAKGLRRTPVSEVPATILLGAGTLCSGRVRLGLSGTLGLAGGSGSAAVRMQSRSDRRFYPAIKGLLLPAVVSSSIYI